jgi:long-subunit fatty acid transport protein
MLARARRCLPALALAVAALFRPRLTRASPEDVIGFGARSTAMGGTGAATAEGYEAVYGNPALLAETHGRELTLGFVGAAFDLRAGAERLSSAPLHGTLIGATVPVPFGGVLADRIVIGLGFFSPTDVVVRGRILYPETPQFPLADRVQSVAVQAGLGVDLGHGVRIGGGFAALAALSGQVQVATDITGRIGTVVEDTLLASYGPILGASYDVLGTYRVGLTFRGALVGRFNVVIDVKDLGDIVVPPLNIAGIAQYDPLQLALEVARLRGPWRLALGATYKHWSAYPGAVEATVRCPAVDPDTGAPFTEPCAALVPDKPAYHDTVSLRVGLERAFALRASVTLRARGGLFFEPSPAPLQSGQGNLYDNHRAALSLGYGIALLSPLPRISLDLFSQVQFLVPRTHAKAQTPDGAPFPPPVTASGLLAAGGLTAKVAF